MKTIFSMFAAAAFGCLCSCAETPQNELKTPQLLGGKLLDAQYASPDGMTIGPDGYIYLSMNQSGAGWKHPAKIMRISPNDELEEFFELPVNTYSGKCSPLGIVFAADGNMYVSDNQSFCHNVPNSAGVMRVVIENGKPVRGEWVVSGFNMSNGITQWGNCIYVAESNLGTTDKHTSGVYRFTLDELTSGDTLKVTGPGDPHLILSFETRNPDHKVGANGLAFDSKGVLYVNNFGDAEVLKFVLNEQGQVVSQEVLCKAEGMLSLDGMQIDEDDNIWTTDYRNNAVAMIDTRTGETTIIAQNEVPVTGENGELDAPSECIRRGDKVYVSNIDTQYERQTPDSAQAVSVIQLK